MPAGGKRGQAREELLSFAALLLIASCPREQQHEDTERLPLWAKLLCSPVLAPTPFVQQKAASARHGSTTLNITRLCWRPLHLSNT
jgi:hypothetical protein